ncbi:MAG: alanine racemase [Planctomycetota bacterium]
MKRSEELWGPLNGLANSRVQDVAWNGVSARKPSVDVAEPAIPMTARAWLQIDLGGLQWNLQQIRRRLAPETDVMAVVKADAYGHGAVPVSRTAVNNGASCLGVATVQEGVALRNAGLDVPIVILGFADGDEQTEAMVRYRLTPTVCNTGHANDLATSFRKVAAKGVWPDDIQRWPVHVKIDTGLSRLGAPWRSAGEVVDEIVRSGVLDVQGVYSHLACADECDPRSMDEQRLRFEQALAELESVNGVTGVRHLANSAATLVSSSFHFDMVRLGLALYGMYPAEHLQGTADLRPLISLKARVTQTRTIQRGTPVSYGSTFVADRRMRVGVLSIGYADGVPFRLSQRMEVLAHGRRLKQLGRITMDQMVIDITDDATVQTGDTVTLLGRDGKETIQVSDWARELETIPWEVLCAFKSRLPRVAVAAPEPVHERPAVPARTRRVALALRGAH